MKAHSITYAGWAKDTVATLLFVLTFSCVPTQSYGAGSTPHEYDYFEVRGGTAHFFQQCKERKRARVAFLGGSITQMTGWRDLVMENLQTRFPEVEFDFIQAGVASMGSTPGAFRLRRDVFGEGQVDLLFVEAAVNDSTNYRSSSEQVRGMEGIVRGAMIENPEISIIMMHFVDPEKMTVYRADEIPEVIVNHEKVASYYNVPSLNLAKEVTERIDAGEFTWEKDFKNLHPSPFGHQIYAHSIERLLDAAWMARESAENQTHLPENAIDEFSYSNGVIVEFDKASTLNGFESIEQWSPSDNKGTRPGFTDVPMLVGENPGDEFTFEFTGKAVGLWVAAGPDAGNIEFTVDGSKAKIVDTYTRWSRALHLPWAYMLETELENKKHTVTVKILDKKNKRSTGNAIRIAHFLVNR